ncbi:hypothetical protein Clacol_003439 [Clathrus columnatus]|uniref:Uncharacterized protein n=1 Tax=Clathrus columnatus TaxID=1419009 RepID=A0AAV5A6D0_9AGAM|nr:hypothetical protein Clacol_003439 [Clathrus columnatus]
MRRLGLDMQQGDSKTQKKRPRAKTGGPIPSFIKSRPSAAVTTTPLTQDDSPPTHLSVDELLSSLTPPAVLSMNHARALHMALRIDTPPLDSLIPVVSRLCAPGTPFPFVICGLEIIAVCSTSDLRPLTDIERASLFAVVRSSDLSWALSKPRYNCLTALTKGGTCLAGFEEQFQRYSEECIGFIMELLLSDDEPERRQKEQYVESHSELLRNAFVKNPSSYTDKHLRNTLQFYDRFVQRSLDAILFPSSDSVSIPSSPSVLHRRSGSSPQASLPFFGSRPHTEPLTLLEKTMLPCQMQLAFLDIYRSRLTSDEILHVIHNLLRMIGAHITPLPHISATPLPPRHVVRLIEEAALNHLFVLLQGPFSVTVAANVKTYLSSDNKQVSLGAFRTIRAVLRDAAISRMALLSLRRSKFDVDITAPTGQMVLTESYTRVLERAHKEIVEVPAFALDRLCKPTAKAIRQWSSRADAEMILEEAVGITIDIVDEACDRVEGTDSEANTSMIGPEEGRFIGSVLSEAVKYVQRAR